jgi:hypothetical protein
MSVTGTQPSGVAIIQSIKASLSTLASQVEAVADYQLSSLIVSSNVSVNAPGAVSDFVAGTSVFVGTPPLIVFVGQPSCSSFAQSSFVSLNSFTTQPSSVSSASGVTPTVGPVVAQPNGVAMSLAPSTTLSIAASMVNGIASSLSVTPSINAIIRLIPSGVADYEPVSFSISSSILVSAVGCVANAIDIKEIYIYQIQRIINAAGEVDDSFSLNGNVSTLEASGDVDTEFSINGDKTDTKDLSGEVNDDFTLNGGI